MKTLRLARFERVVPLAACLALAACGGGNNGGGTEQERETEDTGHGWRCSGVRSPPLRR